MYLQSCLVPAHLFPEQKCTRYLNVIRSGTDGASSHFHNLSMMQLLRSTFSSIIVANVPVFVLQIVQWKLPLPLNFIMPCTTVWGSKSVWRLLKQWQVNLENLQKTWFLLRHLVQRPNWHFSYISCLASLPCGIGKKTIACQNVNDQWKKHLMIQMWFSTTTGRRQGLTTWCRLPLLNAIKEKSWFKRKCYGPETAVN